MCQARFSTSMASLFPAWMQLRAPDTNEQLGKPNYVQIVNEGYQVF